MSLRADSKDQTVEEPPFREMAPLAAAKAAKKAKKKAASSKEPPPKSRAVRAPAWRKRALALAAARDGSYPATFEPQLATLRPEAPQGEKWLHEIKWDGYRLLAAIDEGKAHLRSRNGLDWSSNYPGIVAALESLGLHEARFDGELVALDRAGKSDFSSLVQTIKSGKTEGLSYVIFDMPGIEGVDLSQTPLVERKGLLRDLMAGQDDGPLSFSEHVLGRGPEAFEASRATGVEGIVCKSVDAPYEPGRSATWLKVKHEQTDDFFVVGFTSPLGGRSALGALLLARTTETGLEYVGKVGTGFDTATLKELLGRLEPLIQKVPPVSLPSHVRKGRAEVHWVRPEVMIEVSMRGWGSEGLLRQASFKRIRDDKVDRSARPSARPERVAAQPGAGRRAAGPANAKATSSARSEKVPSAGDPKLPSRSPSPKTPAVRLTHPEKVIYPDAGITKQQVFEYYAEIARWMLPELAHRPVSILRCPSGVGRKGFFQKHHKEGMGDAVKVVELTQKSGLEQYIYVDDERGLLQLAQMNVIEFHPWGACASAVERPDRLIFDLDPDDAVDFSASVRAARHIRSDLAKLGLESFVRLSGGKGIHVVAPIVSGPTWQEVKDFCEAFALAMEHREPNVYVATMSKAKRKGKIFVDWLRNARGATSIASWSLRARPGAPVAMPISWEELESAQSGGDYSMARALERARSLKDDPWGNLDEVRQKLTRFDLPH